MGLNQILQLTKTFSKPHKPPPSQNPEGDILCFFEISYLHDDPTERHLPYCSLLASMSTTMSRILPSQEPDLAKELYTFHGPSHPSSTDHFGKGTISSGHDEDRRIDHIYNGSGVATSKSYCTGKGEVAIDGRSMPTGWAEHTREDVCDGSDNISSGYKSMLEVKRVAAGNSRDALLLFPVSAGNESDLTREPFIDPWASCSSNVDAQESTEIIASGSECIDDDGVVQNKFDGQISPFDPAHIESMWTGPTPCYLGGCRHGRLFKSLQSWYSHVKNVHKKGLFCSIPDCTHIRPFANNTDLKRHVETIHEAKKSFKCQRPRCPRKVQSWTRKDKLKLHDRKYHSNFLCFFCSQDPRHQSWFDTSTELWEHTASCHPYDYSPG